MAIQYINLRWEGIGTVSYTHLDIGAGLAQIHDNQQHQHHDKQQCGQGVDLGRNLAPRHGIDDDGQGLDAGALCEIAYDKVVDRQGERQQQDVYKRQALSTPLRLESSLQLTYSVLARERPLPSRSDGSSNTCVKSVWQV